MGHTARKRFGQNLHDRYVIDQIVAAINPQPGQNLAEIGHLGRPRSPSRSLPRWTR